MSEAARALALKAISHEAAEHLDLIAARLAAGEFELGGGVWRFALEPAAHAAPWPADAFAVALEWGGAPFHFVTSPALLALLYAHQFPDVAVALLPEELALAAFELAWEALSARLEQLSGRRVKLVAAAKVASADRLPAFVWRVALDSTRGADGLHGLLCTDAQGLALLALLARRRPAPPAPAPDPLTPLALRLEVGETHLSVGALRALAVHDIVLLDAAGLDLTAPCLVLRVDDRHIVRSRLHGDALTIESVLEKLAMPTPAADTSSDETPANLDALEVRLSFDLGTKTLTLGELAAVAPGQTFALDAPLPRVVAIRVNGRLIGRGELVQIDAAVGVRVLELAS